MDQMNPIYLRVLSVLAMLSISLSACGGDNATQAAPDASTIATSVEQTVEARLTQVAEQNTPEIINATPTSISATPDPTDIINKTPTYMATTSNQQSGPPCLSANYVADITIPDRTIIKPGDTFTKTWRVTNSGSCIWDAKYSLEFASGDSMGTQYSFPLPQVVYPGDTVDISIQLVAPQTEGIYRGYWRIRTPFGGTLGFGSYGESRWVEINVSTTTKFSVTSVTYNVVRDPVNGCPANVKFNVYAAVTVNGPVTITYHWVRSDGEPYGVSPKPLAFSAAGTATIKGVWQIHRGAVTKSRWLAVYIDEPNNQQFGRGDFYFDCQ
jgi:hypothetical protein